MSEPLLRYTDDGLHLTPDSGLRAIIERDEDGGWINTKTDLAKQLLALRTEVRAILSQLNEAGGVAADADLGAWEPAVRRARALLP